MTKSRVAKPAQTRQDNRHRTYIEKGMRFGRLTIIEEVEPYISPKGSKTRKVLCRCDCGTITEVRFCHLKCGCTSSCGCINNKTPIHTGDRFGRLTLIKEVDPYISPGGQSHRKVQLKCDCGNIIEAMLHQLIAGKTRSCGCLVKETTANNMKTHGHSHHPIYRVWDAMKQRCYNPNDGSFSYYGGRGIEVCESWLNDFEVFYKWAIGNGWKKGLVIDKIDNDKGYSPDNCRFVDRGLSGRNRRLLFGTNTSGYRGIYRMGKKWAAKIVSKDKKYYLGLFESKLAAAKAYDEKAIELDAGHPLNFT